MGNSPKVIGSILAIIVAGLLIFWQINRMGPKTYTVSDSEKAAVQEYEDSLKTTVLDALEKASQKGWTATGSYWAPSALNRNKKSLEMVFGKSFQASDVEIFFAGRDSESGTPCVNFTYQDKKYSFFLQAPKKQGGKYLLANLSEY